MTPEELVETHWDRMLRFVQRYTQQHRLERLRDDMESLVAERLWRAAKQYQANHPAAASFWTYAQKWVVGGCHRVLEIQYTHRERLTTCITDMGDDALAEPAAAPVDRDADEVCDRLLARLSPRQAQVMRLVHLDEYNPTDVSRLLGISRATVYTHLHDGQRKLRKELSPC